MLLSGFEGSTVAIRRKPVFGGNTLGSVQSNGTNYFHMAQEKSPLLYAAKFSVSLQLFQKFKKVIRKLCTPLYYIMQMSSWRRWNLGKV